NLPRPKNPGSSQTSIFDLAVRQAAIHRGEIYYNDRKTPLEAALRNVELSASFDPPQGRYYGDLRYNDAVIKFGAYQPLAHNLDAKFELTEQTFKVTRLLLQTGNSRVDVNASVDDYANSPRAQANYDAVLATTDAARLLENPTLPKGVVRLIGTVNYQSQPNRPLLDTVSLVGNISSDELQAATQSVRTAIRDIKAHYTHYHGNAVVEGLHAQAMGGTVHGRSTARLIPAA